MSKNQKSDPGVEPKGGQYRVSKNSGARALSSKSTSKLPTTKDSSEFSHKMPILVSDIELKIPLKGSVQGSVQLGTRIMVKKRERPEWQMTAVEKMDMAREGVSKKKLESLKSKTNLDYDKLSIILSTNRATLINKKGSEHFSLTLSERIVSIADLYSYGFEVFENEAQFNEWIFRPNKALGGKQPFELLDNHFGREEVKNVIGRIDYGVYS